MAARRKAAAFGRGLDMDRAALGAYINAMNLGTRLFTRFRGLSVGSDALGNTYYEEKRARPGYRARRWVMYAGLPEATMVPPEWHAWLHFLTDAPLPTLIRQPWQKPHVPNATGTPLGYRPPGHDYAGGQRQPTTGDYEAWTPEG